MFINQSPFVQVAGDLATIVLPDISLEIMTLLLTLCYTGEMIISMDKEDQVYSAMEVLMIGVEADFTLASVKKKNVLPRVEEDKPTVVESKEAASESVTPNPPEITKSDHETGSDSGAKSNKNPPPTSKSFRKPRGRPKTAAKPKSSGSAKKVEGKQVKRKRSTGKESTPESAATSTSMMTPEPLSKRRKLDGKPSKKGTTPTNSPTTEAPAFRTNPKTGQIVGLSLRNFPKNQIHLDKLAPAPPKPVEVEVEPSIRPQLSKRTGGKPPTRKLDEAGNPLQLSKRGGGAGPLSKKRVADPTPLPFLAVPHPQTGRVALSFDNIPKIKVHLEKVSIHEKAAPSPPPDFDKIVCNSQPEDNSLSSPNSDNSLEPAPTLSSSSGPRIELICIDDEEEECYDLPHLSNNESLLPIFSVNEVLGAIQNEEVPPD